jgi:hypothetical protein
MPLVTKLCINQPKSVKWDHINMKFSKNQFALIPKWFNWLWQPQYWNTSIDNFPTKVNERSRNIKHELLFNFLFIIYCHVTHAQIQWIVRPTIEYAATVWDPTSQSKIKALENIQRRAARSTILEYQYR